jgi:chromosome segregation ATPase
MDGLFTPAQQRADPAGTSARLHRLRTGQKDALKDLLDVAQRGQRGAEDACSILSEEVQRLRLLVQDRDRTIQDLEDYKEKKLKDLEETGDKRVEKLEQTVRQLQASMVAKDQKLATASESMKEYATMAESVEKQLNKYQGKYKKRASRLAQENEALRHEMNTLAVLLSTKQQEADWMQNGIIMANCASANAHEALSRARQVHSYSGR